MNTGVGIDRKLVGGDEAGLAGFRVNGIDGADFQTGKAFCTSARVGDDVGQLALLQEPMGGRGAPRTEPAWKLSAIHLQVQRIPDLATQCQVVFGGRPRGEGSG